MNLYLAAQEDPRGPAVQSVRFARVCTRVPDGAPRAATSGDVLLFCPIEHPVGADDTIAPRLIRCCRQGGFSGLVADLAPPLTQDEARLSAALDSACAAAHLPLWVTEEYASYTRHARILICTALSGGTLRRRLAECADQYGAHRLALDCQRLAVDLTIPSPSGEGMALTLADLARLRQGRSCFYSDALCANYFTYRAGAHHHFVLYDNAETLRRKIALGEQFGIRDAFFMLPEVADLLEELFQAKK